jgi:hypothetical protein
MTFAEGQKMIICKFVRRLMVLSTLTFYAATFATMSFGDETRRFIATTAGAKGDGATDDTAAIQKILNQAGKKGGSVYLPSGRYLVKGSLRIPAGVTLQGAMESPLWSKPLKGSIVLATGGRSQEDGPALFEMVNSSAVRGLTIWYPEQKVTEIVPYSWTFHLQGSDNTVENITLVNSYNGIRIGPEGNECHRIRSVYGCVLRRGIFVDNCTDIGRIDNIQFHPHWWSEALGGDLQRAMEYTWQNCEAFIFGRSDWQYVTNTFAIPAHIGYHFIQTKAGATNGQFSGIGADEANICVKVDAIQPMGLLISNGQFVCMHGDRRIGVLIDRTCDGSVRLVDCAFWGPLHQCVLSHSKSFVSLSDCYLSTTCSERDKTPPPLVEADGGKLQVRGCSFGTDEPSIVLKTGLKHAIVSGNNGVRGVQISNEIGPQAIIANNEPEQK